MTITICGSLSHYKKGAEIKEKLEKLTFIVYWPWGMEELYFGRLKRQDLASFKQANQGEAIKVHYRKINKADAVLIVNEEKNCIKGYIGGNTLMEMGFAFVLGKPIYLLNPLPITSPYMDELIAMRPMVLKGDLEMILKINK